MQKFSIKKFSPYAWIKYYWFFCSNLYARIGKGPGKQVLLEDNNHHIYFLFLIVG